MAVRKPTRRSRFPIVARLADFRADRGIARADLAEIVGYHVMILGRYERGECTPSLQRLSDWAEALGFELDLRPKQ